MNDKAKKLLSKVFSKEELIEMMIAELKEEQKIFSNRTNLTDLLLSSLRKKEDEIFEEQQEILQKRSNMKELNMEFLVMLEEYKKLDKKHDLIDECMRTLLVIE